jgi:pimeloyl-ACP methyl ester carboxylesterase
VESIDHALTHLDIGDELILFPVLSRAKASDFDHENVIIFIHGFTLNGKYMERLINGFHDNGFQCFMFNYNSYRGIQEAANTLSQLLSDLNTLGEGIIAQKKVSLLGHSMGGLVARAFCYISRTGHFVQKMVTLGTPHAGTLGNSKLLKNLVLWGEYMTSAMPGITNKSCKSAMELMGNDATASSQRLLDILNSSIRSTGTLPILSVSGGKQWIEVSNNPLINIVVNRRIARLMNDQDNDGLVSEDSSNLEKFVFNWGGLDVRHFNNYSEYRNINHSNLTQNYALSLKLMMWIKTGNI